MKSLFSFVVILQLCLYGLFIWGVWKVSTIIKEESNKMESNVGKKVILQKDTLQITDFSFWQKNYKLSNGSEVNEEFLRENLLQKK